MIVNSFFSSMFKIHRAKPFFWQFNIWLSIFWHLFCLWKLWYNYFPAACQSFWIIHATTHFQILTKDLLFCVNFWVSINLKIIKMVYGPDVRVLLLLNGIHKYCSGDTLMVWWVLKDFLQFHLWPFPIVINSDGLYFFIRRHFHPEKNKKEER